MKEVLEPLAMIPGVKIASLISQDGVPITSTRGAHAQGEETTPLDRDGELNGFTALASGWFADLTRATGRLSWSPPQRVVLRATKGEIVLLRAERVVVLVMLERGVSAEEVRVPMQGAMARMQRLIRELECLPGPVPSRPESQPYESPPGILSENLGPDSAGPTTTAHEHSESSGDA